MLLKPPSSGGFFLCRNRADAGDSYCGCAAALTGGSCGRLGVPEPVKKHIYVHPMESGAPGSVGVKQHKTPIGPDFSPIRVMASYGMREQLMRLPSAF